MNLRHIVRATRILLLSYLYGDVAPNQFRSIFETQSFDTFIFNYMILRKHLCDKGRQMMQDYIDEMYMRENAILFCLRLRGVYLTNVYYLGVFYG